MIEEDFMQNLKWSELSEIEDYVGCNMDEWTTNASKAKLAFCMQYLLAKRVKPELTMKDAEDMTMAQQIKIDIVADVQKLQQGVDQANKQLGGLDASVKKVQGLTTAFVGVGSCSKRF
jgi:hypothetical protein